MANLFDLPSEDEPGPARRVPTVHNPSNFEPSDYEVEDYLDNQRPAYCGGPSEAYALDVADWEAGMARALGEDWRRLKGRCCHCGNGRVRYITVCLHRPTGARVVFGADCTERLGFADRFSWKLAQLKSKADAGHARLKVYRLRTAYLAAHPDVAAAVEALRADPPVHARNTFAHDVVAKLNQFGSLSDRQAAALVASLARDVATAARQAVEAAEVKGAAPAGRQTVSGDVLAVKEQESSFGSVLKMLVKLPSNAKVWLTVPSGSGLVRGSVVTVTATFTVSSSDPSFAYGKRPHLISAVNPPVVPVS